MKYATTTCHHSNGQVSLHLLVLFKIVCLTSLSKYKNIWPVLQATNDNNLVALNDATRSDVFDNKDALL